MNDTLTPPAPAVLVGFFHRLAELDQVLRIVVSDARLRAKFTIRGAPDQSVVLDMTTERVCTREEREAPAADIVVAMSPETWHRVLWGELPPGEALGRREMLLRGSPSHLAWFIPLFDFAPMLYREHLATTQPLEDIPMPTVDLRLPAMRLLRREALQGQLVHVAGRAAFLLGYCAGVAQERFLPSLSLFRLLEAMSHGLDAAHHKTPPPRDEGAN